MTLLRLFVSLATFHSNEMKSLVNP